MLRTRLMTPAKFMAGVAIFLTLGFASRLADDISSSLARLPGVPAAERSSVVFVAEQADADENEQSPATHGDSVGPHAYGTAAANEPLPAGQASEPEPLLPDRDSLRPVYASGYVAGGEVTVAVPSSDVALATTLERQVATLSAGACHDFSRWRPVDAVNVIPHGSCARYRTVIGGGAIVAVAHNLVRRDDTPPPPPQVFITESSGNGHADGDTFYYRAREGEAGTFTVTAVSKDPESGVARLSFPALGENASTHRAGPSASVDYDWSDSGSTGAPTAGVVAAVNAAGSASEAPLRLIGDAKPPAGTSLAYHGGVHGDGRVEIVLATGEDTLSGIEETLAVLEQSQARLARGRCFGGWSGWHAADPGGSPGRPVCVRFRYRVSDNVGNQAVYESSVVAKVIDAEAPTVTVLAPEDGATVGETVTLEAQADDTGFGVATVRFEFNRSGRPDAQWITIATTVAPHQATWSTSALPPGCYYVRALATDRAGNRSASDRVVVNIVEPAISEPTDAPVKPGGDPQARPDRPTPEEPTSPEAGTMPEREPASAPEGPTMPEEPHVQASPSEPERNQP
jgi:hypothetical protein